MRTCIAIEQRLPRQIFDIYDTKLLDTFSFEINLLKTICWLKWSKEDVRDRRKYVEMLRVRKVVHEGKDEHCVHPEGKLKNERSGTAKSCSKHRAERLCDWTNGP